MNDVVLAVCSGALRAYLEHHGELPQDESLSAMAPISVRSEAERGAAGNAISLMSVRAAQRRGRPGGAPAQDPTHHAGLEGHLGRGRRAHDDRHDAVHARHAGRPGRAGLHALGLANRMRPFLNTVITNVPGPQLPLYFTGAKMVSLFGMGPIADGMGLIHPVFSYSGRISISVTACREQMPDPGFYAQCLQDSFDSLRAATRANAR